LGVDRFTHNNIGYWLLLPPLIRLCHDRSLDHTDLMVLAIALVTIVSLAFLNLSHGIQSVFTRTGSGEVALILRDCSQSELNRSISAE
jgi:hypothetical protein